MQRWQQYAGKPLQAPKIILKSLKLIVQKSLSYVPLLKKKMVEFHIFDKSNLSDFVIWKYTTKEDLNRQKHGVSI